MLVDLHGLVYLTRDGMWKGIGQMVAGRIRIKGCGRMIRPRHGQEPDHWLNHPAGFKTGVEGGVPI